MIIKVHLPTRPEVACVYKIFTEAAASAAKRINTVFEIFVVAVIFIRERTRQL